MRRFITAWAVVALGLATQLAGAQTTRITVEATGTIAPGSIASPWPLATPVPAAGSVLRVDYTIDTTTPSGGTFGPGGTGLVYPAAITGFSITIDGTAYAVSGVSSSDVAALSNGQCPSCVPAYSQDEYQAIGYGTYAVDGQPLDFFLQIGDQSTQPLGTIVTGNQVGTIPVVPAAAPPGSLAFVNQISILYAGSQLVASSPFTTIQIVVPVPSYPSGAAPVPGCTPSPCSVPVAVPLNGQIVNNGAVQAATPGAAAALQAAQAAVTEQLCTVAVDPRLLLYGTCTGHPLAVADVCPGFGATVIPDYLCGAAGPSLKGFALIRGQADAVDSISGLLFSDELFSDRALGGSAGPQCPFSAAGWAPRSDSPAEGTIPEGNLLVDFTDGCGSNRTVLRGLSITGVGLSLNTAAMPGATLVQKFAGFGTTKYANLLTTIQTANIAAPEQSNIAACVAASKAYSDKGEYACAARRAVKCDQEVVANATSYGSGPNNPNAYGDVRARLANLYLNSNTRILGRASPTAWPVALGGAPACLIDDWATHSVASLPGDLNGDGVVGCADVAIIKANIGKTVPPGSAGDINGDGVVNVLDLALESRLLPAGLRCP